MTTNRKPTTVIPNILLRLQARQNRGDLYKAHNETSSRISRDFREMGSTGLNTTVPYSFISSRMSSWQAHLTRISPFLLPGKGVWWLKTPDGYKFLDGSDESDSQVAGPSLRHFRNTTLDKVYLEKQRVFQNIIDDNIEVPAPFLRIYSSDGTCVAVRAFDPSDNGLIEQEPQQETQLEINMEEQEINIEGEQAANMEEEEYREREANMEEEEYREREANMEEEEYREREANMEEEEYRDTSSLY